MEKIQEAKEKPKDFNEEVDLEDLEEPRTIKGVETTKKRSLEREVEEENEEPSHISWLWYISFVLLITADLFEIVVGFLGVISGGLLSFLGFLPMLFEIPGGLIFLYLINYYIKKGYLPQLEGGIYMALVLIEFFGFLPFIGSLVETLPLKSIATITSRARLWRIKRLKSLKKEVEKQKHAREVV